MSVDRGTNKELNKNNSNDMNAIVETYFIEETVELIYDDEKLSEWNKLNSELGIELINKSVLEQKSPIPFMWANTHIKNIAQTLCPVSVDFKNYNKTPIPLEVLKLISLSIKEKYFTKIEIWYNDVNKDPFCVGIVGKYYSYKEPNAVSVNYDTEEEAIENSYNKSAYFRGWDAKYYIIAKWGDVKKSFEQLKKEAYELYINTEKIEIDKEIKVLNRKLEDLRSNAVEKFGYSE